MKMWGSVLFFFLIAACGIYDNPMAARSHDTHALERSALCIGSDQRLVLCSMMDSAMDHPSNDGFQDTTSDKDVVAEDLTEETSILDVIDGSVDMFDGFMTDATISDRYPDSFADRLEDAIDRLVFVDVIVPDAIEDAADVVDRVSPVDHTDVSDVVLEPEVRMDAGREIGVDAAVDSVVDVLPDASVDMAVGPEAPSVATLQIQFERNVQFGPIADFVFRVPPADGGTGTWSYGRCRGGVRPHTTTDGRLNVVSCDFDPAGLAWGPDGLGTGLRLTFFPVYRVLGEGGYVLVCPADMSSACTSDYARRFRVVYNGMEFLGGIGARLRTSNDGTIGAPVTFFFFQ